MYNIEWKEHALQNLEKLENSIARRIIKKEEELSKNPFSQDIKRLKGENNFRLRVGDYQIIFLSNKIEYKFSKWDIEKIFTINL